MKMLLLFVVLMLGVAALQAQPVAVAFASAPAAPPAQSVVMRPAPPPAPEAPRSAWRPRATALNWVDYSILAATGAAAVVAIQYKAEADRLADRYEATGDRSLRPEVRALDRRAGLALVGVQVGVGAFAVRLLLR